MSDRKPHIVIIGAGFAGLSAAKALRRADADITVIDRRNHHLFQPLLYQVATAGLSPHQIANPIRSAFRDQQNARVLLADVIDVDKERCEVITTDQKIPFDFLIIATGAETSYFGNDQWAPNAPGLKSIADAIEIRKRILIAMERAENDLCSAERQALLTFVIIGGGPTGVEMAGAIAELTKRALICDFRAIRNSNPNILLVEAGPRLLPTFPAKLSLYAEQALCRLSVEILVESPVSSCDESGVTLNGRHIDARTIVWAAGVRASPAADWLGACKDQTGRAVVGPDLSLEEYPNIFVIGDTASVQGKNGEILPGLAPVAKQQGAYVARRLQSILDGDPINSLFRYKDYGALATIGRNAAVADFGARQLKGFIGWIFWSLIHVFYLIGFRNRLVVGLDWIWSYFTFERGARLIPEGIRTNGIGRDVGAPLQSGSNADGSTDNDPTSFNGVKRRGNDFAKDLAS